MAIKLLHVDKWVVGYYNEVDKNWWLCLPDKDLNLDSLYGQLVREVEWKHLEDL